VLGLGVVGSADAFYSHDTGIDWDVIFLLLGMMFIVGMLTALASSSTWPSGRPNAPRAAHDG
jgi:Na+/H+ antiporter NhaD/arsenite permease-like protein